MDIQQAKEGSGGDEEYGDTYLGGYATVEVFSYFHGLYNRSLCKAFILQ
jgi:hypothetical protein